MKHIFYVHSNICIVSIFDTVLKIINESSDKILILQNRGCKWFYYDKRIEIINCEDFRIGHPLQLRKENLRTIFGALFKYRCFLKRLKETVEKIINAEPFVIYLPTYNNEIADMFIRNVYCKGYYFIEEGSIDYLPLSFIKKISCHTKQAVFKKIIFPIIGTRFFFILHQNKKFLGCIALYEEAFSFIKKTHFINKIDSYVECACQQNSYSNIIVTGYLFESNEMIKASISLLLEYINPCESVAIKVHPEVYSYPEKIELIRDIIKDSCRDVVLLDASYSVELSIFIKHSNIYSLFTKSSLMLYAIKNSAKAFVVTYSNDSLNVKAFISFSECLNDIVENFNYK